MAEKEDQLEVKTSLGSVKATGNLIVLLVVIGMGVGFLAYMQYMHDKGGVERYSAMVTELHAMKDAVNEQTYVSTLTDQKKHDLNLDMPDSLRRKLGR